MINRPVMLTDYVSVFSTILFSSANLHIQYIHGHHALS